MFWVVTAAEENNSQLSLLKNGVQQEQGDKQRLNRSRAR